jgi:hypothetical protein
MFPYNDLQDAGTAGPSGDIVLEEIREIVRARRKSFPSKADPGKVHGHTTGLMSLLITTFRYWQAGKTNEGMAAMPSPASTMAIIVSR